MNKKLIYILKLLFSLLFFFYFGKVVVLFFDLIGYDLHNISIFGKVIYQFIMSLILLFVLLLIYYNDIKDDFLKFKDNKNIKYIIKMFLIFMVVKFGVSILSAIIMIILKIDTNSLTSVNQNLIEQLVAASPFVMVLATGFVGPIYEEILFRMGFKKAISNKKLFVFISGLIFGLMHIFPLEEGISLTVGLIQSISYVSMGIFLGYVYVKSDNIFTSIGIHFLNNFLSVLVMINMM